MSKAILISIRKEHNEKIFNGSKRFEGRNSKPKIILSGNHIDNTSTYNPSEGDVICYVYEPKAGGGSGKVVGEFVCDFLQSFHTANADMRLVAQALCTSKSFTQKYFHREIGYMLRVCVPKRYDKPKELRAFSKPRGTVIRAFDSQFITRPPQSWCYVEEVQ